MIGILEAASEQADAAVREEQLTFVVAGAGFAGVEVSSEIDELVRASLALYPHLSRDDVRIICVDPGTRVLPSMSQKVSAMAYKNLTGRGIEVRLGTAVASTSAHTVRLSNGELIASRIIWRRSTVPNTVAYGADLGRLADFLRAPALDSAKRLIVSRRASQRAATLAIARAARSKCSGRTE